MLFNTFQYKTLCEVVIRHAYFLNKGTLDFDDMLSPLSNELLSKFQFTDAFEIVPSAKTASLLKNLQIRCVFSTQGFKLVAKTEESALLPLIPLADEDTFVFAVKMKHPQFPNITKITSSSDRLLLLTNSQPSAFSTAPVFMPQMIVDQRIDDTFLLSAVDSKKLQEEWFVPQETTKLFGIIHLKIKGNTAADDLLTVTRDLKVPAPIFKIHFDTQNTHWKYIKASSNFEAETTNALPLTKHGYIAIDPATDFTSVPIPPALDYFYPNPMLETFEVVAAKTYSVIFI